MPDGLQNYDCDYEHIDICVAAASSWQQWRWFWLTRIEYPCDMEVTFL